MHKFLATFFDQGYGVQVFATVLASMLICICLAEVVPLKRPAGFLGCLMTVFGHLGVGLFLLSVGAELFHAKVMPGKYLAWMALLGLVTYVRIGTVFNNRLAQQENSKP